MQGGLIQQGVWGVEQCSGSTVGGGDMLQAKRQW
jgi:hypothetical protein